MSAEMEAARQTVIDAAKACVRRHSKRGRLHRLGEVLSSGGYSLITPPLPQVSPRLVRAVAALRVLEDSEHTEEPK